jgi:hypothetical protein
LCGNRQRERRYFSTIDGETPPPILHNRPKGIGDSGSELTETRGQDSLLREFLRSTPDFTEEHTLLTPPGNMTAPQDEAPLRYVL